MRVLIAAPRKTGSSQLRCLLASAYELELLSSRDAPENADFADVASWLGELPERSVTQSSFRHSSQLDALAENLGITLVAILRHPFDLFVSLHEIAQRRLHKKGRLPETASPWMVLAGKEIDDPAVTEYAMGGFSDEIAWLIEWHDSSMPVVRFEVLEEDPSRALDSLSVDLGKTDEDLVARAIAICPAENLVRSSPVRGRRMPAVSAGTWRERLPDELVAILRERYGDAVQGLGYELT